ncbi:MAG TPA: hypothetical protein VFP91_22590 [Vicinamibacterales bacterium]|nr:hypothetical protein [Vicinamibacterales bacterium]
MTVRRFISFGLTAVLVFGVEGCRRSPESKIADQLSKLSAAPEQKRLWQQAADKKLAVGLQRVERSNRPVTVRLSSPIADQTQQAPINPSFPTTLVSGLRITSTSGLVVPNLTGMAVVTDVDSTGERVTLDLGGKRTLSFVARVGGKPLGVAPGDQVRIEYHASDEHIGRRQILAVRANSGSGIVRITETGRKPPLTVSVPLFDLDVTQSGQSYTSVDVRVGNARKTMRPGEKAQLGGMAVQVIANRAVTGPDAKTLEGGNPYAVEFIAWK